MQTVYRCAKTPLQRRLGSSFGRPLIPKHLHGVGVQDDQ
jgi:hypothetical protein